MIRKIDWLKKHLVKYFESDWYWLVVLFYAAIALSFAGYAWSQRVDVESMLSYSAEIKNLNLDIVEIEKIAQFIRPKLTFISIMISWTTIFGSTFFQTVILSICLYLIGVKNNLFKCIKLIALTKLSFFLEGMVIIIIILFHLKTMDKPFNLMAFPDLGSIVKMITSHNIPILHEFMLFSQIDLVLATFLVYKKFKKENISIAFYVINILTVLGKAIVIR